MLMSEGLLKRKHVMEKTDKKARHRSWKSFYVVLEGSELFFYKPLSSSKHRKVRPCDVFVLFG
jgi:Pleckstrin homology domain